MSTQNSDASNKQASSTSTPHSLVSLPSLSCALYALPQATSMQELSLHHNMYAHRAAESEALLQKVLSKTAANMAQNPPPSPYVRYPPPSESKSSSASSSPNSSSHLMMRTKKA